MDNPICTPEKRRCSYLLAGKLTCRCFTLASGAITHTQTRLTDLNGGHADAVSVEEDCGHAAKSTAFLFALSEELGAHFLRPVPADGPGASGVADVRALEGDLEGGRVESVTYSERLKVVLELLV